MHVKLNKTKKKKVNTHVIKYVMQTNKMGSALVHYRTGEGAVIILNLTKYPNHRVIYSWL